MCFENFLFLHNTINARIMKLTQGCFPCSNSICYPDNCDLDYNKANYRKCLDQSQTGSDLRNQGLSSDRDLKRELCNIILASHLDKSICTSYGYGLGHACIRRACPANSGLEYLERDLSWCTLNCYETNEPLFECYYYCSTIFIEDHDRCPCQKGCSNGCPCEDFDYEHDHCWPYEKDLPSVLVLQHGGSDNKLNPFVIDYYGQVNTEIDFSFEERTDLNGACSVNYRDRAYVFGGLFQPRQVRS